MCAIFCFVCDVTVYVLMLYACWHVWPQVAEFLFLERAKQYNAGRVPKGAPSGCNINHVGAVAFLMLLFARRSCSAAAPEAAEDVQVATSLWLKARRKKKIFSLRI